MESIGDTLREARHHKRASLEDASRATKIKMDILEQLEADEFDRMVAPAYTKGFLKLYAEYLGLDSQSMVEAYLRSQGGLRRQGLHIETEKAIRAHKRPELQLPLRRVGLVVAGLTVLVLMIVLGKSLSSRHASLPAQPAPAPQIVTAQPAPAPQIVAAQPAVPQADFDAYYQPKTKPAPELLEPIPTK
jgi:cytoskeletal protein RodZ